MTGKSQATQPSSKASAGPKPDKSSKVPPGAGLSEREGTYTQKTDDARKSSQAKGR